MFNIPISGTMAHSWVMFYRDEFEAFKHYAENYPDATVLLVAFIKTVGNNYLAVSKPRIIKHFSYLLR